ncbi:MAG: sugar phosphate isomerase/epimerase [Cyclobacteriaceae bacterium]|nr:sugar phosphate isomerase/epimerase [Cyclobacteriaceae bacterium]
MNLSRRKMLKNSGLTIGASMLAGLPALIGKPVEKRKHNFTFCLNTSTIREQNLGLMGEIEIAAKAGYNGIEIWTSTLEEFVKKGGHPSDVHKKAKDLGIKIENAIGFPKWIVDDDVVRKEAIEQAKKEMELLSKAGCYRMAAPPVGATESPGLNLSKAAERYLELLKLGDKLGVLPQLELWGFSANLHLFGEVLYVAAESGHPKACILPDVYHIYKGGSDFNSLKLINGPSIHMFHMNDYPADPSRETIADKDRIYPGDGVAPLDQILKDLNDKNSPIVLSLELFNKSYWKQDALAVAKTGLEKMKKSVDKALL